MIKITTTILYFEKYARINQLQNNHKIFFHNILTLRIGETKIAKGKFYAAKKPKNIWDVNFHNIVTSKLVKTKTNSKYLIGYLDKVIRPLVLIMPKMSGYVKIKLKMKIKIRTIN